MIKCIFNLFCLLLILLVTACSQPAQVVSNTSSGAYWPTDGWRTSTPEEQGMDSAVLDKMQKAVREQGINLHSLLIIRHGYIVSETYYPPFNQERRHELYSVTKSFISTLVGMAVDEGKINVDAQVLDLLPPKEYANLDERKQAMTVRDLLTMTSGLEWAEGDPIYRAMYMSRDWVKLVMDLPMESQPGEKFVYCSGCSHVLSSILEQAVGMDAESYARRKLFGPLGIHDYSWEKDAQGITLGGWGLQITPRDMAKLGYLYLHNGEWEGQQLLSADWVKAATTQQVDADGRLGYGYQWWIYDTHSAYTALGRDGQTIWVSPELDLIVVTTAQIDGHDLVFGLIDDYVVKSTSSE